MKKIIAATDFSQSGNNAVLYAFQMATALKADLILFHSLHVPVLYTEIPIAYTANDMIADATTQLNALKDNLLAQNRSNIRVGIEVLEGDFFNELNDLCVTTGTFLVILGSQGNTIFDRLIFGSHSTKAVRELHVPFLTVPATMKFAPIKSIALAYGFEKLPDTLPSEVITTLIEHLHALLLVFHISNRKQYDPELVHISKQFDKRFSDLGPSYYFVSGTDTIDRIINFIDENNVQLLILLPQAHSIMERLIFKSHTKQLIQHCKIPIVTLHSAIASTSGDIKNSSPVASENILGNK